MREISAQAVADEVKRLFLEASFCIGPDVEAAVSAGIKAEPSPARPGPRWNRFWRTTISPATSASLSARTREWP